MSNYQISIIIPIYNVDQYIERCLRSVLEQYTTQIELVLVDDGSVDGSVNTVQNILSQYADVQFQLIRNKSNKGVSAARNTGVAAAQGNYIYFVDSDDELEKGAIACLLNAVKQYPSAPLFIFNASFKDEKETTFRIWREKGTLPRVIPSDQLLSLIYKEKIGAYLWQYLFMRDLFKGIKFKEGAVWEDAIVFTEILLGVKEVISFDELFIYKYCIRAGSITQGIHPTIDNVIPAFDELEKRVYIGGTNTGTLHGDFVVYRSSMLMRLSRECFVRTKDYTLLMKIHRKWGKAIPWSNIRYLWRMGKKRTSSFLLITKYAPNALYLLYKVHLLK